MPQPPKAPYPQLSPPQPQNNPPPFGQPQCKLKLLKMYATWVIKMMPNLPDKKRTELFTLRVPTHKIEGDFLLNK